MNALLLLFYFPLIYSSTSTSSFPSAAESDSTNDNSTLISFRRYFSDYTNRESVEQDASKTTSQAKKQRRAATARKDRIWPHGVIPYVVAANFSGEHRNLFHRAMRHWENFTCISFVPKEPHHKHYIMFTVDKCGCCSYVGRRGDGPQAISIGKNCDKFGIVVHELGHVVGFWHEHTRPDRDQYVDIFYKNVLTDQHYNFEMSKAEEVNSLGEPYDFGSIMHYSRDTFSRGTFLDTILPKTNSGYRAEIGQRVQLSEGDIRQTKKLYKCPACGGSMLGDSSDIELKVIGGSCVWRIIAAEGQTIFLNISGGFLPEPSIACSAEMENFIIVRDGYSPKSSILDKFCGGSSDYHTLVSTGSRMFLEVRTKSKTMVPPISIGTYYSICGGPIHSENGIIQSPRYPEAYPPNADCVWTIKMPEGYQVAVEIIYFHLEQHKDCIYDRVLFWEGSENSKPLANLCGIIENRQVVTTYSNQMTVRFISDNSVQKFGFELRFTKELDECQSGSHNCEQRCLNTVGAYSCDCSVGYSLRPDGRTCESTCGGFLRSSSGSFASPNFPEHYPPSKNCVWEIEAEEGYQIFLNFTKFNVEGMKTECAYDYVQIGKSERLCGEYENPLLFTSTTNRVRVEFASDSSVERSGFSAHFIADLDECQHDNADCEHICQNRLGFYVCQCNPGFVLAADGHNCKEGGCTFELNEPHGEISSPNYPNEYPKGQNCTWHFVTTPGHRLTITFNSFQIEEHSQCQYDAVVVHDGGNSQSPVTGVFCGLAVPPVLMSSTNELFLAFSSDSSVSRKGFTASYTSVCGGSLKATDAPGHIYSHATFSDSKYGKNQDCHWLISARTANRGVRLEFTTFAVEGEGSCPYDYVEVYDETEEIQDKLFGRFCGDSLPVVITSTGSDLLLVLHTDDTEEEKGFVAEYREALKSRDSPRSVANRLAAQRQRPIGELINNPS